MDVNLNSLKYDFPTQNVMLFAVGSGIAPIKAAIESGQFRTGTAGGRSARVYYGERTPGDICFTADHFARWEAAGVEVVPVLSQPPSSWGGRSGYIQNALEEDGVSIPRNSGALLCGMKGMAESVKDVLVKAGVFEGRVLTNF
jgi:NAD(P)H-flavin reductase